jgi:cell division transport system ATP-binding protein
MEPGARSMVEFRAVSKVYVRRTGGPVVTALSDLSFQVASGEAVLVSGSPGAGKSTLIRLAAGEERPSQGRLLVDGDDAGRLGRRRLAGLRRRLGLLLAEPRLLADRSALDNVALVPRARGASRRAARLAALAALRETGLSARATAWPAELTSAEHRRLCLARALVGTPRLLLADEPTAGLDATAASEIVTLLRQARGRGITLLVASGSADLAPALGARSLTLAGGRIVEAASPHGAA